MGAWLRAERKSQDQTLKDVADAIGKLPQFVCDVEHGRRGQRMDPIIALLWCDYLSLDPSVMFSYLGMGETDLQRYQVQHYLETAAWAHRFTQGKRALEDAMPLMDELLKGMRTGPQKSLLFQIRDAMRAAIKALRVPQTSKERGYAQ